MNYNSNSSAVKNELKNKNKTWKKGKKKFSALEILEEDPEDFFFSPETTANTRGIVEGAK